jgi:N-acetylmuramoyl-L-alanine amidase
MATTFNKPNGVFEKSSLPGESEERFEHRLERNEALQALLAFSALHQQIRERRNGNAAGLKDDAFKTELFVLDEVLNLVAERARAITGADGIAIALAEGEAIICRAAAGPVCPDVGVKLDPRSDFSGACVRAGLVVRCDDAESDLRVNQEACRKLGTLSMVAVPLCGPTRVVGLVQAFSRDAFAFNDSDVRSLTLLAELLLAALKPEDERGAPRGASAPAAVAEDPSKQSARNSPNWKPAPKPAVKSVEVREGLAPLMAEQIVFDPLDSKEKAVPGLGVVLSMVLVAGMLAGGLWWKLRHETAKDASTVPAGQTVASTAGEKSSTGSGAAATIATDGKKQELSAVPPDLISDEFATQQVSEDTRRLTVLPKVTGIRHWSSPDTSTVVIDLQDQVPYEAHRLSSPERIYFDLHDTVLAESLVGKAVAVGDALLSRVRVAQPVAGVTRIVLDTAPGSDFAVSLEQNPYRLVVSLRGSQASAVVAKAKPELFPNDGSREKSKLALAPTPSMTSATAEDKQLRSKIAKFRVVVDAGHGGWDLGTVGRKGLLEKDLVLEIAQRLGRMLESRLGTEVVYTRRDDNYLPLDQRADVANEARADLFVSIHANYSDYPSARGVETYYTNVFTAPGSKDADAVENTSAKKLLNVSLSPDEIQEKRSQSRKLAASVQRALYGTLVTKNPTLRNRGVKEASFVVLKGTTMPSILAEVSFVSSPADEVNLRSAEYRQQIAEALYKGIARYAATSHRASMASAAPMQ